MQFETIDIKIEAAKGTITLNRPNKLNPLSPKALLELAEAAHWFNQQREVKVVIIKGAGRAFSAGADLNNFAGVQAGNPTNEVGLTARESGDLGRQMAEAVEDMRAVTIAQIHGHCVGGGVVLVAACDLRVAAEDAKFSIPEVAIGIPLAWGGIPRLVREIGAARTRELVLTCRPFSPAEAVAMGFLNQAVPVEQLENTVNELADLLMSRSALTLSVTKRHVNAVLEGMSNPARSFGDGDALASAFNDPESRAVMARYLKERGK